MDYIKRLEEIDAQLAALRKSQKAERDALVAELNRTRPARALVSAYKEYIENLSPPRETSN
jgi:hypothetical protein